MPTPGNIKQLILQVARYELVCKPLGALLSLHGVPTDHEYHPFFSDLSVGDLHKLYQALNATPESVISMIKESNEMTSSQARVFAVFPPKLDNLDKYHI